MVGHSLLLIMLHSHTCCRASPALSLCTFSTSPAAALCPHMHRPGSQITFARTTECLQVVTALAVCAIQPPTTPNRKPTSSPSIRTISSKGPCPLAATAASNLTARST
eukprot:scaffold124636_cov18-Tisochrysis_lutea.AAC.3